ncbi:hypothetical protein Dda_7642 [Drechslerella dactyloides]|uniref:SGNH hydrolase-type esterase domain-containing protein n=1 Tax=Drechslerella dactyloides TaxID=74499 RepID=A0AAD6ISI4_DREDA|nr:hypothetical protein Dda_7642 [Drechslerella dactyloides]
MMMKGYGGASSGGWFSTLRSPFLFPPLLLVLLIVAAYARCFERPLGRFYTVKIDVLGTNQPVEPRMPMLHLLGDSSMCRKGTNNGVKGVAYEGAHHFSPSEVTDSPHLPPRDPPTANESMIADWFCNLPGWGEFMKDYMLCNVTSHAVSGRSTRFYAREGRFDTALDHAQPGDYVVMQFGRNDKGRFKPKDNGKGVCPGPEFDKTCDSVFEGKRVKVHTFTGYMANATRHFLDRGVHVIIAAPTTNNPYSATGKFYDTPTLWGPYSKLVADAYAANVTFVDHFVYGVDLFRRLGKEETQTLYPVASDRSHTNPRGADRMAQAFLRGLMCTDSGLKQYINMTAAQRITGEWILTGALRAMTFSLSEAGRWDRGDAFRLVDEG